MAEEWVTPELVGLWTERYRPELRPPIAKRQAPWPVQLQDGIALNQVKLLEAASQPAFWD